MKRLLSKLNNKHFLSLATNGITAVLSVITVAVLNYSLAVAENGIWIFFQTVFVLIDTFRTGFLQTALIKFYSGVTKQRAEEVVGSVWYLGSMVTLISFVITGIAWFLPLQDKGIQTVVFWFSITFLATLPNVIAIWVLQAQQQFDKILLIRVLNQGSFLLFVFIYILLDELNITNVLIANLASCIVTDILCFAKRWTVLYTIKKRTKSCIEEIYHFGKYSVGTTISANLLRSSDVFIIKIMLGDAAVGIYSIPQKLMEFIEIPLRSFLVTALPSMSAAFNQNNKEEVAITMKRYAGLLMVALIPVAIGSLLLADVAVAIIGGPKYVDTEAANVFRIFMAFAIFLPLDRFIGVTLDVIHLPKINFIKVVIMLAINVVADVSGIYIFKNVYGVAIASIPTFYIGILFGFKYIKKNLPLGIGEVFQYGFAEAKWYISKMRGKA